MDESFFSDAKEGSTAKRLYWEMIEPRPETALIKTNQDEATVLESSANILFANEARVQSTFASYPCRIVGSKFEYAKSMTAFPFQKARKMICNNFSEEFIKTEFFSVNRDHP